MNTENSNLAADSLQPPYQCILMYGIFSVIQSSLDAKIPVRQIITSSYFQLFDLILHLLTNGFEAFVIITPAC